MLQGGGQRESCGCCTNVTVADAKLDLGLIYLETFVPIEKLG